MNESQTNDVGNAVSYEVLVDNHAKLLLDPDDWPAKRASFLQHDIWVTPYDAAERYAGGEYMFQSNGSDGLAGVDRARSAHPQSGHRGLGEHGHAPPDAR